MQPWQCRAIAATSQEEGPSGPDCALSPLARTIAGRAPGRTWPSTPRLHRHRGRHRLGRAGEGVDGAVAKWWTGEGGDQRSLGPAGHADGTRRDFFPGPSVSLERARLPG